MKEIETRIERVLKGYLVREGRWPTPEYVKLHVPETLVWNENPHWNEVRGASALVNQMMIREHNLHLRAMKNHYSEGGTQEARKLLEAVASGRVAEPDTAVPAEERAFFDATIIQALIAARRAVTERVVDASPLVEQEMKLLSHTRELDTIRVLWEMAEFEKTPKAAVTAVRQKIRSIRSKVGTVDRRQVVFGFDIVADRAMASLESVLSRGDMSNESKVAAVSEILRTKANTIEELRNSLMAAVERTKVEADRRSDDLNLFQNLLERSSRARELNDAFGGYGLPVSSVEKMMLIYDEKTGSIHPPGAFNDRGDWYIWLGARITWNREVAHSVGNPLRRDRCQDGSCGR